MDRGLFFKHDAVLSFANAVGDNDVKIKLPLLTTSSEF